MNAPLHPGYHDISATEFKKHSGKTLEALREQFDDMVARMQTSKARKAVASIGTVKPATLGKAAQRSLSV